HQIRVALVHPERDLSSVLRITELHMGEAILVPLKVGERMVEHCRADWPRLPEIVFGVFHGYHADRKAALIGPQDCSPRYAQHQTIDSCGPKRQVRMSAAPKGTGLRAEVGGRCPNLEAVVR